MLKPAINLQTLPQQSATVISFILVIACAYSLAQLTWMLIPSSDTMIPTTTHVTAPLNIRSQRNNISHLVMAHLFGTTAQTAINSKQITTVTQLDLVLRGVFAASDPKYGIAIIASGKSGDEEVYGVGDPIPGNAILHEVHANNVILERNGQLEILKLPKDTTPDLLNTRANNSYGNQGTSRPGATLGQIRRTILRNPTSFGDYALPMVIRENGKQVGYRLQAQAKGRDLLRKIGLEPNDIITSIDGIRMDDPRNGISALRKLSTAQSVNITVKRNGAEVPLTIQLQ